MDKRSTISTATIPVVAISMLIATLRKATTTTATIVTLEKKIKCAGRRQLPTQVQIKEGCVWPKSTVLITGDSMLSNLNK